MKSILSSKKKKKKKKKERTLHFFPHFNLPTVSSLVCFFHFSGGIKFSDLNAEEGKSISTFHFLAISSFSFNPNSHTSLDLVRHLKLFLSIVHLFMHFLSLTTTSLATTQVLPRIYETDVKWKKEKKGHLQQGFYLALIYIKNTLFILSTTKFMLCHFYYQLHKRT